MAEGRPLRIYTDGELEDPEALAPLVGGSSVVVDRANDGADVAIAEVRVPRVTVGGDTLDVDVALTASGQGGPPSRLTLTMGDRLVSPARQIALANGFDDGIAYCLPFVC